MKFGKNIGRVVELSDPEWSPFWVNYKFLKKKAKVCVGLPPPPFLSYIRNITSGCFFAFRSLSRRVKKKQPVIRYQYGSRT